MNQNLGRVIMPISRAITQEIAAVLKPFNLTPGERPFYLSLAERDGITQEMLTAEIRVDKSTTARMLQSLERKGFVERRCNPEDKRSKLIYMTKKGRDIYDDVLSALTAYNRQFEHLLGREEYESVFFTLLKVDEYLEDRRKKGRDPGRDPAD
ncbi:MAG: MarR family winged helix-turn-helix transcriptional regulator [Oscillospiraceae bacterium]|nr:MarR family winged helix-turn-helix transcriptional regulator [Oscillospiraceae bacterium]